MRNENQGGGGGGGLKQWVLGSVRKRNINGVERLMIKYLVMPIASGHGALNTPAMAKLPFHHLSNRNARSRLEVVLPLYRPWYLIHHIRPTLDHPHHQTRNLPAHNRAHAALGPDRDHLRLLHWLVLELFRGCLARPGQIDQDGRAERAHGIHNIHDTARGIRRDVSDRVDAFRGSAQGLPVGNHVTMLVEPGSG